MSHSRDEHRYILHPYNRRQWSFGIWHRWFWTGSTCLWRSSGSRRAKAEKAEEKIKTKKVLVDDISKLKDKKISSFEIDRKLVEALNKINFVKSQYTELETDEDVIKLTYDIEDIDESLRAFKKFYNETIVFYNKLIRKFPYNIIGKILKYKEKTFFDGKDMNDDDIKDFKL